MTLKKIGKVYHATIRTASGKQKSITTRTTSRREAEQVVNESGLKDLEHAAKAGRLTTQAIGLITTGRKMTIAKCIEPFREWMQSRGQSPRTIERHVTTIERWMHDIQVENMPPSAITEKQLAKWVNRKTTDAGYLTRSTDISSIRSFFAFLCAKGWVAGDPSQAVGVDRDTLSHEQKEPTVREPFNNLEVKRLLTYLEKQGDVFWGFAVRLARSTGLRLSDIAQLEWKCFETAGKVIVHTGKTNQRIEQPMTETLTELLTEIPVESSKYLFPEQRDIILDVKRRAYLSVQFGRLCAKAGVQGKSFHSLRHTAATEANNSSDKEALVRKLVEHLSLKDAQKLLGHASSDTTKRYVH